MKEFPLVSRRFSEWAWSTKEPCRTSYSPHSRIYTAAAPHYSRRQSIPHCLSRRRRQAGEFEGMMRYDARVAVEKALDDKGLLRGKEPHKMRLGLCSRSGDVIEPIVTPQW